MLHKLGIFCIFAGALSSCGLPSATENMQQPNNIVTNKSFELTGPTSTPLEGKDVLTLVNQSKNLVNFGLVNFGLVNGRISLNLKPSAIQSNRSTLFSECVTSKLENTKLGVTADTITFDSILNLTAECDRVPPPEDHIQALSNVFGMQFKLTCSGQDLSQYKGKSLKDVLEADICSNSNAIQISFQTWTKAEKSVETKVGSAYEVTSVQSEISASNVSASNGGPCQLIKTDLEHSILHSCVFTNQSKQYSGHPKYAGNSPAEKNDPRPVVTQEIVSLSEMTMERNAHYYTSGTALFQFNGWNGTMAYTNGWVEPKWAAQLGKEAVSGTYGSVVPSVE
jgi:hypothetical protein